MISKKKISDWQFRIVSTNQLAVNKQLNTIRWRMKVVKVNDDSLAVSISDEGGWEGQCVFPTVTRL